jgi:protein phosphatase
MNTMPDEPGQLNRPHSPPELEELVEALDAAPLAEPLAADAVLTSPEGRLFRILGLLRNEPHGQLYQANSEGVGEPIWLRAGFGEKSSARLRHEAQVLAVLDSPLFPRMFSCFTRDGATFLATTSLQGCATYADLLASGQTPLAQVLIVLSQAAFALRHLHQRGWVHLGLRPGVLALGKPLKILDLSFAARLGEKLPAPFYHAGYSAPELLTGEPLDARADIYAIGALLYHAVNGAPIREAGAELSPWQPAHLVAGVPQILHRCLGDRESRYNTIDELHRDLLRLTRALAPRVSHSLSGATTIGLDPTRTTNQDAYAYLTGQLEFDDDSCAWSVACLADGMGGMQAGEMASAVAVQAVMTAAAPSLAGNRIKSGQDQLQMVQQWVVEANDKVCAALASRRARGGCTILCACLVGKRLAIGHVGDCRLYLLRGDQAKLLTQDHSLAMALVQKDELRVDQVRSHPDRNKVTRSLGERHPLSAALVDTLEQATGSSILELQAGDLLLLCCDGLWEPVLEEDMLKAVAPVDTNLGAAVDSLLSIALTRGGTDNATAVVLRLDEKAPTQGAPHAEPNPQAAPRQPESGHDGRAESVRDAETYSEAGGGQRPTAAGIRSGY